MDINSQFGVERSSSINVDNDIKTNTPFCSEPIMSGIKTILVIGATGRIGKHIAKVEFTKEC